MNKRTPKTLVLTALIAAVFLTQLSGCGSDNEDAVRETIKAPVEVSAVARGPIESHYLASAPLTTERDAQIVSETQGAVLKLLVEEGDRVEKGQALAQLDVERATLSVAQTRAQVARLRNDQQRLARLGERRLVSREMLDQSSFELKSQQASLELAQLTVDKATIRAPFAGVITARQIKLGQLVKPNDPVFSIADFGLLTVALTVPERQAHALKVGQSVEITFDAFRDRAFVGAILRMSPVVDAASGTLDATVEVKDPDGVLRPGLFARLNVLTERRENALLIPKAALVSDGNTAQVWAIEGDQAKLKPIRVGLDYAGVLEVLEGLTPDARVVIQGQEALSANTRVQVLKVSAGAIVAR